MGKYTKGTLNTEDTQEIHGSAPTASSALLGIILNKYDKINFRLCYKKKKVILFSYYPGNCLWEDHTRKPDSTGFNSSLVRG
jgi:hypothetical protein